MSRVEKLAAEDWQKQKIHTESGFVGLACSSKTLDVEPHDSRTRRLPALRLHSRRVGLSDSVMGRAERPAIMMPRVTVYYTGFVVAWLWYPRHAAVWCWHVRITQSPTPTG